MKFKIKNSKLKIAAPLISAFQLFSFSAFATLSAEVTPGYQFPLDGSVAPSYWLLNLLGTPTVTIYGTVGGSNSLSPGSVTVTELNASVADYKTLDFNGALGALEVMAQGIHTNNIDTNDWVWPLGGGNASPVQLYYDPVLFGTNSSFGTNNAAGLELRVDTNFFGTNALGLTFKFPTNSLPLTDTNGQTETVFLQPLFKVTMQTNVVGNKTNAGPTLALGGIVPTVFTTNGATGGTANYTNAAGLVPILTAQEVITAAHNLNYTPGRVDWRLVCAAPQAGYAAGDEISITSVSATRLASADTVPAFCVGANAGTVYLVCAQSGTGYFFCNKTNAATAGLVLTNWNARCYILP